VEVEKPREAHASLIEFTDYRELLRAVFATKKRANPRFSFRGFSQLVGFKSPNYLQMILEGHRHLSLETAATIATRLKFPAQQKAFFLALVKLSGAANEAERMI
jgi:uncharacterized protein (TIGR02147 family)